HSRRATTPEPSRPCSELAWSTRRATPCPRLTGTCRPGQFVVARRSRWLWGMRRDAALAASRTAQKLEPKTAVPAGLDAMPGCRCDDTGNAGAQDPAPELRLHDLVLDQTLHHHDATPGIGAGTMFAEQAARNTVLVELLGL